MHYCRMLLTRHYDQRPFDETMCDAIIANGGVKNHQKRCKTFTMEDASNTVQILVVFVIRRHKRNGQPDEGVCDIRHTVHLVELFALSQEHRNGQPDQGVCD